MTKNKQQLRKIYDAQLRRMINQIHVGEDCETVFVSIMPKEKDNMPPASVIGGQMMWTPMMIAELMFHFANVCHKSGLSPEKSFSDWIEQVKDSLDEVYEEFCQEAVEGGYHDHELPLS